MAEIAPPRSSSISDPNSGAQDQPAKKPRPKSNPAEKPPSAPAPEVSAPDEEDKHELDEMA
jgi:hypothetical protein